MTGLAGPVQVGQRTEVASGALARYLSGTVVATVARTLGVLALQADGVSKIRVQTQSRPILIVAGRVGTEARIVGAKTHIAMTVGARLVHLEAMVAHEPAFQV